MGWGWEGGMQQLCNIYMYVCMYVYYHYGTRGSKYPTSRVVGHAIHTLNGFSTILNPYYLDTSTFRVTYRSHFL